MGRDIHYCGCGEEIFDDMEQCRRCEREEREDIRLIRLARKRPQTFRPWREVFREIRKGK